MKRKVLFSRKGLKWKIMENENGELYFTDDYNSDYIVNYGGGKWACDFPERLPKYIKEAMTKILLKMWQE